MDKKSMLGETGGALGFMLYHCCPVSPPDEQGYSEFLLDLHCRMVKVVARFIGDDDNMVYDVKDVELLVTI